MLEKLEKFLKERKKLVFAVVFLLSFLVISFGINQTGETWDEIPYYNAGRHYYFNLSHLDFKSADWSANKEHPPVAKFVYGLFSLPGYTLDGEHYTGGRIASALMMSLTIALTFSFAAELFSLTIGLVAAMTLMFSPPFIAYGRILGMDSISALAFLILAIVCWRFAKSRARPRDYIAPTFALGLAFATRYNTIIGALFGPVAIMLFASWRNNWRKWLGVLLIPSGAAIIFYLIWPFLWSDPIGGVQISFGHWGQVKEWFMGTNYATLPNSYFLTYFLFTTPIAVIALMLIGIIFGKFNREKIYVLCLLTLPFINSFIGIKQGGIRYLLFVWIPIAIFAGYGLVYLLRKIKKKPLQIGLFALFLFYLIFNVVWHYPYYLDYYNELIAGSRGNYQKKLLQLGWWGEGAKRTGDYLNKQAPAGSTIFNNTKPDHTLRNLRDDLRLVAEDENPDYIIVNTNWSWVSGYTPPADYTIVHEEKSAGAPIVSVYKRD